MANKENCYRKKKSSSNRKTTAFARSVSNTMLIYSDDAYSMALIYYNLVKGMANRGDPTAMELYSTLKSYFRKSKSSSAEPTEKQAMRDVSAIIHGKKDGKFIAENIKPKLTGGVHKIIDEKFTDTKRFKENNEGEIEE